MTATETTPTTAPVARKGWGLLPCVKCGAETNMALYLDDLTTVRCGDCEEEIALADIRDLIARWSRVLAWVDAAPSA